MTMGTFTTFGIVEETTPGTTPASALQLVNAKGLDLNYDQSSERPPVFTGSRRRLPSRRLKRAGMGKVSSILQYENTLALLEGLMMATRGAAVTTGSIITIGFSSATNKITDSAVGFGSFQNGDRVYVSGAGAGANANKWFGPITAKTTGEFVCPTGQLTTVAAGSAVTIRTRRLIDGSTLKTYSVERLLTQLTTNYKSMKYSMVNGAQLSWGVNTWVEEQYDLIGRLPVYAAATIGTGAAADPNDFPSMASTEDFVRFQLFGGGLTTIASAIVSKWDLSVANNVFQKFGLGSNTFLGAEAGPMNVDLALSLYMDDYAQDLIDEVASFNSITACWDLLDPYGNKMSFSLPGLKPEDSQEPVSDPNSPVNVDIKLSAHDPERDSASAFNGLLGANTYQLGAYFVPGP